MRTEKKIDRQMTLTCGGNNPEDWKDRENKIR